MKAHNLAAWHDISLNTYYARYVFPVLLSVSLVLVVFVNYLRSFLFCVAESELKRRYLHC